MILNSDYCSCLETQDGTISAHDKRKLLQTLYVATCIIVFARAVQNACWHSGCVAYYHLFATRTATLKLFAQVVYAHFGNSCTTQC